MRRNGRRSSAISFLDIVGYSTLMAENRIARTHLDLDEVLNEILRPAADRHAAGS